MKKIFLLSVLFVLTFSLLSNKTFAQTTRDAGGSTDGTGGGIDPGVTMLPPQPCPTAFSRNNGDGTCGGEAQVRVYFTQAPNFAPTLENILYNDQPLFTNMLPVTGNVADIASKGYISYCLAQSNIPPAVKLTCVFHYDNTGQADCSVSGTN